MAKQDQMEQGQGQKEQEQEGQKNEGLVSHIGPVQIDWPRSIGYYGGIGLAMAFGLIEPPLAIFIAAVPFFKMLNQPKANLPTRFVSQLLEGAAKPVGGEAEATIRLETQKKLARRLSIMEEARQLAESARGRKGLSNGHEAQMG